MPKPLLVYATMGFTLIVQTRSAKVYLYYYILYSIILLLYIECYDTCLTCESGYSCLSCPQNRVNKGHMFCTCPEQGIDHRDINISACTTCEEAVVLHSKLSIDYKFINIQFKIQLEIEDFSTEKYLHYILPQSMNKFIL